MQTIEQETPEIVQEKKVLTQVTNGQNMDVRAMLIPEKCKISVKTYPGERPVMLGKGTVLVEYVDHKKIYTAPANFIVPPEVEFSMTTFDDEAVCYIVTARKFVPVKSDDLETEHIFSEGVYARKMTILSGSAVPTHEHVYDHISILAKGRVRVAVGPVITEYVAPAVIEIKKNIKHAIAAMEDSVWICIHATDATDVETLEETIITRN